MRRLATAIALFCAIGILLPLSATGSAVAASVSRPDLSRHTALMAAAQQQMPFLYKVRPGDTLSTIAAREYGSAELWPDLWWSNRNQVSNPNVISVGEHLRISNWRPHKAWVRRRAMQSIPAPAPAPVSSNSTVTATSASAPAGGGTYGASGFEACVIARESGGNPTAVNPTSGAGGLFQFLPSTWAALGYAASYPGGAQTAPASVQIQAFWKEYAQAGTAPWSPYDGC